VIPIFVGIALIINGIFVSKSHGDSREGLVPEPNSLASEPNRRAPGAGDIDQAGPATFSVTEGTTKHLGKLESHDRIP
jgi:hypothetical protein